MNFFAFSGFLNCTSALILGIFVYRRCPRKEVGRAFGIYNMLIAGWSLFYGFWWWGNSTANSELYLHWLMVFAIWINQFYLNAIAAFLGKHQVWRRRLLALACVNVLFTVIHLSGHLYGGGMTSDPIPVFWPRATLMLNGFFVFWQMELLTGYVVLWKRLKSALPEERLQVKYMLIGLMIAYVGGYADWMVFYSQTFRPYLNPLISVYVAVMAYAIAVHHLMDISILVKRTLVYSLIVVILAALDLFVISFFASLSKSWFSGHVSAALAASVLTAVTFRPLLHLVQRRVDAWLAPPDPEREKAIKEFSQRLGSSLAHEVKTPLANIALPAQLSYLDVTDALEGRQTPEAVLAKIQTRMRYITEQALLASRRVEAVRETVLPENTPKESLSILTVMEESLKMSERLLEREGIEVVKDFAQSIPPIQGNARQLEVVFCNLIKNAAEAMSENPPGKTRRLTISLMPPSTLQISDTGPGIAAKLLPSLFKVEVTTKPGGSGVGLRLAYQIVQSHGGVLSAQNLEGGGAQFTIAFMNRAV